VDRPEHQVDLARVEQRQQVGDQSGTQRERSGLRLSRQPL